MIFIKRIIVLILSWFADQVFLIGIEASYLRKLQLRLMKVSISGKIRLGHKIYIKCFGNLKLGNNCCIGSFTKIWNYSEVVFGDNFLGAGVLTINTGGHKVENLEPYSNSIIIGNNVWCGVNVTILGGVTIGNNAIIGANSLVTSNIPENCIAVGIPAKPIKFFKRTDDFKIYNTITNK